MENRALFRTKTFFFDFVFTSEIVKIRADCEVQTFFFFGLHPKIRGIYTLELEVLKFLCPPKICLCPPPSHSTLAPGLFDSHHLLHRKLAVAKTLHQRIDSHIQKPSERKFHLNLTKKTLTLNGFPARFTHPFSKRKTDKTASTQLTFSGFTTLPYIKGVSDKIKRLLLETGVQTIFNNWQISPFLKRSNKSQ